MGWGVLFDVEEEPFEVFALGVIDAYGMIRGLPQLLQDAHRSARLYRCCEYCQAKIFGRNSLRTTIRKKETAGG